MALYKYVYVYDYDYDDLHTLHHFTFSLRLSVTPKLSLSSVPSSLLSNVDINQFLRGHLMLKQHTHECLLFHRFKDIILTLYNKKQQT